MNDTPPQLAPSDAFSLVRGGPTYRLWRRLGLVRHAGADMWRLPAFALAVGWIPLVFLALLDGLMRGSLPHLARDLSVHARLALAIPMFCLAEIVVDVFSRRASSGLLASRLIPGGERDLARVFASASRLRDSWLVELALLVLAMGGSHAILGGFGPWRDASQTIAAAEWSIERLWYAWVGLPLFLLLGARWVWRLVIWTYVLARCARLRIEPEPLHPDGCGGLAFLSEVSTSLAPVAFAFSCVASGAWASRILHTGLPLSALRPDLALWVATVFTLAFAPLFVFAPHLSRARLRGRQEISRLGLQYARLFRAGFVRPTPADGLLDTSSVEGLASLHDISGHVGRLRAVPIARRSVMVMLAATLAPFVPLLFTTFSLMDLASRLGRSMLGTLA
jgi:hypothetical protein